VTSEHPTPTVDVVARIKARTSRAPVVHEAPPVQRVTPDSAPMAENLDNPTFEAAEQRAHEAYQQLTLADQRRDQVLWEFIAFTAFLIREARRDPVRMMERAKAIGLTRKTRGELKAVRVAAGLPKLGDGEAHWANAAAYVAEPPNGDKPPETVEDAVDYIDSRGGVKKLSELWAHRKDEPDERDITEIVDALLDGLKPDFHADVGGTGYARALIKLDTGAGYILWGTDSQLKTFGEAVRKRGILEEGIGAYVDRMRGKAGGKDEGAEDEEAEKDEPEASVPSAATSIAVPVARPLPPEPTIRRSRKLNCGLRTGCQHAGLCGKEHRCRGDA